MWRHWILLLLMVGLSACGFSAPEKPTPEPDRPQEREIIYISTAGRRLLSVTVKELTLLAEDTDAQILMVLADGNGNPAYLLYPSNQPGLSDRTFDFSDYPLLINTQAEYVGLWVLAFHHRAYPIADMKEISEQLANGFDLVQEVVEGSPLAAVVAEGAEDLLAWFGEIEVYGELRLTLRENDGYLSGENHIQSPDRGFYMIYEVKTGVNAPAPTPLNTAPPPSVVPSE